MCQPILEMGMKTKFKVGDRVRLIKSYSEYWPLGHEFTVKSISKCGTFLGGQSAIQDIEGSIYASDCVLVESVANNLACANAPPAVSALNNVDLPALV